MPEPTQPTASAPWEQITWVRLAAGVGVESTDAAQAVLFHKHTARRVRVPNRLYRVLMQLESPRSVAELESECPTIRPALVSMLTRGFLVDGLAPQPVAPPRQLSAPPYTAFHAPRVSLERTPNALPQLLPQITLLGVPFDLGSVVVGGQRKGPAELRLASNEYPYGLSRETGEPTGWFDVDSSQMVLEGVSIGDVGDLFFEYGETQAAIYTRLGELWNRLWTGGTLPVVLGGDHSITFSLVEQLQTHTDVAVVWFDAHTDESFLRPGQTHHYGNVLSRILQLPGVRRVVQVGTRGFSAPPRSVSSPNDRLQTISASRLRRSGPAAILAALPPDLPCYVSLDLDVLDPAVAPAVGTPVPGGLLLHELEAAVEALGLSHRVEGLDLVELNPDRAQGSATASAACRLLLKALSSAMFRRLAPAATLNTFPIAAWQRP